MGTDMIEKATDSFERKQRRCLEEFEEPNLFTGVPQLSIALVATPEPGRTFALDEECRLSLVDDRLVVIRGITIVGHIENPPSSVLDTMRGPSPSAFGRVLNVFRLTSKAEILLE
jgi:hypothetical protein